jgi:hypothetical protein
MVLASQIERQSCYALVPLILAALAGPCPLKGFLGNTDGTNPDPLRSAMGFTQREPRAVSDELADRVRTSRAAQSMEIALGFFERRLQKIAVMPFTVK